MSQPHLRVPARPASTLILLRDGEAGIEVFMLQRTSTAKFAAGAFVFPGGQVDQADQSEVWAERCLGLTRADGQPHPGLQENGLPYLVAAVRECFEEAGLLMGFEAEAEQDGLIGLHEPGQAELYAQLRADLIAGNLDFDTLCRQRNLRLATDRIAYLSRWITPVGQPKRFDTRFYMSAVPPDQTGTHDNVETTQAIWVRPADALERFDRGEIDLFVPTRVCLRLVMEFDKAEDAIAHAHGLDTIPFFQPRRALTRAGFSVFNHTAPQFAEIRKVDPEERCLAWGEIVPGMLITLSPTVQRVTAPNPGMMTGPGTNTYLIGQGGRLAVIDPGPADPVHVAAILEHVGERQVDAVLVTHTHRDHSPACVELAAALEARQGRAPRIIGIAAPAEQDETFKPTHVPAHGESLDLAGLRLRVYHTPGHASNHLCYLHESEHMLFTGDHIMQGSTVIINPPDGDMSAYLESLHALEDEAGREKMAWLAPAHGFLIEQPVRAIKRLIAHRLARESKVLDALEMMPGASLPELLKVVYDDVPASRNGPASRSLLAHLEKLKRDGRAVETDAGWLRVINN